ncbi:hypothetical protein PoB_002240500 [Plakobranchus ocellatus]|uniref:Uncharacterized protein n=1 Tax=Plakobranchus ocellatus TaxID=259542 RepID=A0AAV3ZJR9_9GAST|nr:hypothetical protein PoB_002240500 [Plakobranchus ocellatus]
MDDWFLYIASPQQGGLRLSGPPPGQGASGRARTRDRRIPAGLRADSLSTVPPTLHHMDEDDSEYSLISTDVCLEIIRHRKLLVIIAEKDVRIKT